MSIRINRESVAALCLSAATVGILAVAVVAQERDRAKIPDQYKWNLADIYPTDAAWRAAKDKLARRAAAAAAVSREARLVGRDAGRRARQAVRARQGAVAPLRLREHARRPGHARRDAPGHAAGDGAARRHVRRARRRSSSRRSSKPDKATLERFIASEPRLKIYRFYLEDVAPARGAHAQRRGGEAARRRRPAGRRVRRTSSTSCRTPISRIRRSRSATAGRSRSIRPRYSRSARAAESRRSREGDVGVLQEPRRVSAGRSARR